MPLLKRPQVQWSHQNEFLHKRHGHKKDAPPETILVALYMSKQKMVGDDIDDINGYGRGLDLLSWAINVAARPRDSVVALIITIAGKGWGFLPSPDSYEAWFTNCRLIPLREICRVKKVQLDIRFAIGGSLEKVLAEYATSSKASMTVISSSAQHSLRYAQKRGNCLARQLPEGCSVVVVKDFKVLYYKDNTVSGKQTPLSRQDSDKSIGSSYNHGMGQVLAKQLSMASDTYSDNDSSSPRGVHEGPGLSSESDCCSTPSSTNSRLSFSLSQKRLLSRMPSPSPFQDDDDFFDFSDITAINRGMAQKPHKCLRLWRNKSIRGATSFHLKRLTSSVSSSNYSMRLSIKSYLGSAWNLDLESQELPSAILPSESDPKESSCKCFSFDEIFRATDGFNAENLVGMGGYAEVYRGLLPDGRLIAVKRLRQSEKDEEKERSFLTELGILGHVSHTNTTPLMGFCVDSGLHLIFSFSPHGSLSSLLHGTQVLEWSVRYKVAVGTAQGLHYLHTGCQRRIIHRDIKASNILLNEDFEPQISDFGLAKWLPEQLTHLTVANVEGTFGYLAPEYFMHGIVDERTDVFAFGVLLLELITGRQPIDNEQHSLVMWARPLLESGDIVELADPCLNGAYDSWQMQCMVMAATTCVHRSSECRPYMSQVLDILTGKRPECSNGMKFHSRLLSQLMYSEDSEIWGEESDHLDDLNRHREIALQF